MYPGLVNLAILAAALVTGSWSNPGRQSVTGDWAINLSESPVNLKGFANGYDLKNESSREIISFGFACVSPAEGKWRIVHKLTPQRAGIGPGKSVTVIAVDGPPDVVAECVRNRKVGAIIASVEFVDGSRWETRSKHLERKHEE